MRLNWNSVAEVRSRLAAVTDNGIKPRRSVVVKWVCDWVGCFLRIKTSFDGLVRESHLGVGRARPLHAKDKEDGHSLSALGTGSGPGIHRRGFPLVCRNSPGAVRRHGRTAPSSGEASPLVQIVLEYGKIGDRVRHAEAKSSPHLSRRQGIHIFTLDMGYRKLCGARPEI